MAEPRTGALRPAPALYRAVSLLLAAVFAAAGCLFLFLPAGVLAFFNALSRGVGMREGPAGGATFYLGLAAAYMYVVTALAFSMYRSPGQRIYPLLLLQAKAASAILSLGLFLFDARLLIYLCNAVVDAALTVLVALMLPPRPVVEGGG